MKALVFVFLGGGFGSLLRHAINSFFSSGVSFLGTLLVNIVACLILGFLLGMNARDLLSSPHKLLLATGFCGGFSTFSTFSGELVSLGQQGHVMLALLYALGSLLLGIVSIVLGMWISRIFYS